MADLLAFLAVVLEVFARVGWAAVIAVPILAFVYGAVALLLTGGDR